MSIPTKSQDRFFIYDSPLPRDLIIIEERDCSIPKYNEWTYGELHETFPDHVLVHVVANQRKPGFYTWYYASKRYSQDEYNFEFAHADIGGTKFSSIIRTYIHLRSEEFDPEDPPMGSSMPNYPEGKFHPGNSTPFTDRYVLAEKIQKRIDNQTLDSLFIVERRTYIKRCSITRINQEDKLGIGFSQTTRLYYKGELIDDVPVEDLFADPSLPFWGTRSDGTFREGEQLSCDWFAVTQTSSLDEALEAYSLSLPSRVNLTLPSILKSVSVVWNTTAGSGSFDSDWTGLTTWNPSNRVDASLSGSESASAEGSASIQPEVSIEMEHPTGRDIPSISLFFYMRLNGATSISINDIRNKVSEILGFPSSSIGSWPAFKPISHVLALRGQRGSVSAKASASAAMSARGDASTGEGSISRDKNEGSGVSHDRGTMNGSLTIPPSIHPAISISNNTQGVSASAFCDVGWTSGGTGQIIAGQPVTIPATVAKAEETISLSGHVSPVSLPATSPSSIPSSGIYIVDSKVSPYRSGWVQIFVEVIDASNL